MSTIRPQIQIDFCVGKLEVATPAAMKFCWMPAPCGVPAGGMAKRNHPSSRTVCPDPGSDKKSTKWEQLPGRRDVAQNCPLHSYPGRFYAVTHESFENRLYSTTITRLCDKKQFYHCDFYCRVFLWKEAALKERQLLRYASAAALFCICKPCRCRSPPFHSA